MTNAELFKVAAQRLMDMGAPVESLTYSLGAGLHAGRARVDAEWGDSRFSVPFVLLQPFEEDQTGGIRKRSLDVTAVRA